MGSFYINVRDGETLTRDPKPYLYSSAQAARESVLQVLRELIGTKIGDEPFDLRRIEIADETGHPIAFVDVQDVRSGGPQRTNSFSE